MLWDRGVRVLGLRYRVGFKVFFKVRGLCCDAENRGSSLHFLREVSYSQVSA